MGMQIPITFFLILLSLSNTTPASSEEGKRSPEILLKGKTVFEQTCQWCHGIQGNGKGPASFFLGAYSAPRPRDFTVGNYKFRSTPADEFPTDQDLFRTVTNGIPGAMPSFSSLSMDDRWAVIQFIKSLNSIYPDTHSETIKIKGVPVPMTPESLGRGREVFFKLQCHTCHGNNGKGDAEVAVADKLKDSTDLPIHPTDLTNRFAFKNGVTPRDIVRTLLTGLVGTPMPSYDGQFERGERDAWDLANFILSLSPPPLQKNPS